MPLKLRCTATGDLLLLTQTAHQLLGLLNKNPDEPGILETKDMPAALATLRGLTEDDVQTDAASAEQDAGADADSDAEGRRAEPAFADEHVSLRKRAWPLIQMIERALEAGKPIVWGV